MSEKKVLIVEDDLVQKRLNSKWVEQLGHKVVNIVTNGKDAINSARVLEPDLILMDVRIEGNIDGIDAMHEIVKFSKASVIYITSNNDEYMTERIKGTHCLAVFNKPITVDDLKLHLGRLS